MYKPIHRLFSTLWYSDNKLYYLLVPFAIFYCAVVTIRRELYIRGYLHSQKPPVPVIIVGNISVGGTGKTPLIIDLAQRLSCEGHVVGILCHGYKGKSHKWPIHVTHASDPVMTGDEALLLARRTDCPVVAGPDRVKNAQMLYEMGCNIILSDDGLQHYALHRDIEILTLDNRQGKYNKYCLPAGPFREAQSRIEASDFIVSSNELGSSTKYWHMSRKIDSIWKLSNNEITIPVEELKEMPVHAIAGIGNPEQFFAMLETHGLTVIRHDYPDHYHLTAEDFEFNDAFPIVMTEKDAVKYPNYDHDRCWVIRLEIEMGSQFYKEIFTSIKAVGTGDDIG